MKLSCLLAAATSALAATASAQASRHFKLRSRLLTSSNPTFNNLLLEPYHIYPAFNYAVLAKESAETPGITGYINGTTTEIKEEEGDLVFDYGSSPPPYGFVIDQVNATYNPIEINAGNGTQGVFIDQGVIKYHNPLSGGFYGELDPLTKMDEANIGKTACNNTLLYGPAVQVFYKPKVIVTPAGCSDVELVVEYV